eukprot:TRINITY_DN6410_c0_g1_i1.p1 TRINITY_DN6410_c0_g1~~TRINITY_DN6410_c0_g1_i1.p1  ORF type:complete len:229 (+),score=71.30 TRINITY_DN6410_c0_g1_i1:30-689(+)
MEEKKENLKRNLEILEKKFEIVMKILNEDQQFAQRFNQEMGIENKDEENNNLQVAANNKRFDKQIKGILLGLDESGKTSFLYMWKLGERVETIPTIGFNCEAITKDNIELTIYDVGGQEKIRPLWRHYYGTEQYMLYMIDSSDRGKIEESKKELFKLREITNSRLIIVGNKQDKGNCMNKEEIINKFDLNSLNCDYEIFLCSSFDKQTIQPISDYIFDA